MKKIIFTLSLIFFIINAFANSSGKINGKVIDKKTGEELPGANIIITGTTIGTISDLAGNFSLSNLEPGVYDISCSFISYKTVIIRNVVVKRGEEIFLNLKLLEKDLDLGEITITDKFERKTENSIIAIQKKTASLVNGISAQEMSINGDNNAAASLSKVTGISIDAGKYVYVRGLGDRYSKIELNGAEIPSLDPNRNSVQLDLFPNNIIDNMMVYKTFSPNLPASFTGGYVNIVTKDFPTKFTFQFSTSLGFNPQTNLNSNFITYKGGKLDFLGIDDGTRELPKIAQDVVPYRYQDDQKLDDISKSFNKTMTTTRQTSFFNNSHSFSLGNQVNFLGKPLGFIASLSYNRSYKYYNNGENGHYTLTTLNSPFLQKDLQLNDEKGTMNVLIGGILNLSYRLSKNNKISLNIIHNHCGNKQARYQEGWSLYHEVNFQTRTLQFSERSFSAAQLRGEHTFKSLSNLNASWMSSYTHSKHDEPDLRFFTNIFETSNNDTVYEIDIAKQDLPSRYFRNMNENNFDNRIDFELPFSVKQKALKFQFGGVYTLRNRIFRENIFTYKDNNNSFTGKIENYLSDSNIGMNVDNYQNNYGIYISDGSQLSNNYDANQSIFAAYIMFDMQLSDNFRAVTGIRTETTDISVKSKNPANPEGVLNNIDWLPALNLTYKATDKTNFKASYTKTLARPSFRELAPYASFEFSGDFIFIGNENLQRTIVDNYDIRWEHYINHGELISLGYFYKHFHNPIERTFVANAVNDELTFENVDDADIQGIEFEIRKKIDFINALRYFKIGGNLTLVNSTVSIQDEELSSIRATNPDQSATRVMCGQSPYIINAFLDYNNSDLGLNSRLTYNISGKKLAIVVKGGTPNIFEQPQGKLNFNIKKNLGKNISLKFAAKNLLNSSYKKTYNYKGKDYIFSDYSLGRSFSIGFNYLIN